MSDFACTAFYNFLPDEFVIPHPHVMFLEL